MKTLAQCLVGLIGVLFFFTVYSSAPVSRDAAPPAAKFIEVCSNGTAYVPPETKFVTCYGRVMRVIAIVPAGGVQTMGSGADCNCPRCCDGMCGVTVSCGGGSLCTAYIGC
jgi:hypothetical protein